MNDNTNIGWDFGLAAEAEWMPWGQGDKES